MKKIEFTNFSYRMIDSNTDTHKAVEVSYERNGKPAKRYLFIKTKVGVNYIEEAKKIIQKEIDSGKLNKTSKKFITNSHKGLKVAIATVLGIGAVTFSGLYTWKYFQTAQLQESLASIEETVKLIKELDQESTEEEIKVANEAFDKLTDEEKAEVPQVIVNRLEKQTHLFNEDKRMATTLEATTEKIKVPDEALPEDIIAAQEAYNELVDNQTNNRNRRIKLLSKSLEEYKAIIDAADASCDQDIEATQIFIDLTEDVYIQEDEAHDVDIEVVKELYDIYNVCIEGHWRRELLAESSLAKLDEIKANIDVDEAKVKNYEDEVDILYPLSSSCTADDIAKVQLIYDEVSLIKRPTLLARVKDATDIFDQIKNVYNDDVNRVQSFISEVNSLNPDTCTNDIIAAAEQSYRNLFNVKHPDLLPQINDAKAILDGIRAKYDADKKSVDDFEHLVNEVKEYNRKFNYERISQYMKECSALINGTPGKRSDLKAQLDKINNRILEWKNAYERDYSNVQLFISRETALNDNRSTCTNKDIELVEDFYNDYVKSIERPDLVLGVDVYYQQLVEIRTEYDAAKDAIDNFVKDVDELYNNRSLVSVAALNELKQIRKDIDEKVKHPDLFEDGRYATAHDRLDEIIAEYESDQKRAQDFIKKVTDLANKEEKDHTCEEFDINPLEKQYVDLTVTHPISSTELINQINESNVLLVNVRKAYEVDHNKVTTWCELVEDINENSSEAEIVSAEETYIQLKLDIKRPVLSTLRDEYNERLIHQREMLNIDIAAGKGVNSFISYNDDFDAYTAPEKAFLISSAESYRDEPPSRAQKLNPRARSYIDPTKGSQLMTFYSHLDLGEPGDEEEHDIDVVRNEGYQSAGYIPTSATGLGEVDAFDYTTESKKIPIGRGEAFNFPLTGTSKSYELLSIPVDILPGNDCTLYFKEYHYGTNDLEADNYHLVLYDDNGIIEHSAGISTTKFAEIEFNFGGVTLTGHIHIVLVCDTTAKPLDTLDVALGDLLLFKNAA